ncbi:hypothetical protein WH7805_07586 [Synechococcus sp. WH 7805]|nr:hypothetical protein WH7805_07586 [Synechococcus sp. WH 7805]
MSFEDDSQVCVNEQEPALASARIQGGDASHGVSSAVVGLKLR